MARAGQVIENPVTGERVKWHVTTADTDGAFVRFELWCAVGGGVRTTHVHRQAAEQFEILGGTLVAEVDGVASEYRAGDRVSIPAGRRHAWWNGGADELHVMIEVDPALGFEPLLETAFGLARDGRVHADGSPHLLQLALFLSEFGDEIGLPGLRGKVLAATSGLLAPLARRRGLQATYERYTGDAPVPAMAGAAS